MAECVNRLGAGRTDTPLDLENAISKRGITPELDRLASVEMRGRDAHLPST